VRIHLVIPLFFLTEFVLSHTLSARGNITERSAQIAYNYEIDCNVCVPLIIRFNWMMLIKFLCQLSKRLREPMLLCFLSVFCLRCSNDHNLKSIPFIGKGGSWIVNVERTPASRRDSECAGYNRCSHGRSCGPPPGGWTVNPNAGV